MKNVLMACTNNSRGLSGEYPYLFSRADLTTTVIAHPKYKCFAGSNVSQWIDSSDNPDHVITQLAKLVTDNPKAYDWIILGDDDLVRAIATSNLSDEVKTRIGPVQNTQYIDLQKGKCGASRVLSALGFPVAPFRVCETIAAIPKAIAEIGLPAIVKPDHSLGSDGVIICKTQEDVDACLRQCRECAHIVEKYIIGKQVRIDPLFFNGKLVASNASLMMGMMRGDLGVSTARGVISAAPYFDFLTKLGTTLKLNGMMNIGVLHEGDGNDFHIFEMDCRPNTYPCQIKKFDNDFAEAILAYQHNPDFDAHTFLSPQNNKIARNFGRDILYNARKGNITGMLKWLINDDNRWQCLPLHDPRLMLFMMWLALYDIAIGFTRKLTKALKLAR